MFLSLSEVCAVWKSEDDLVMAGSGMLGGELAVDFAWLGGREIGMSDLQGLCGFLAGLEPQPGGKPLLLLSETPGFRPDPAYEAAGMILDAGRYRRLQQEFRDRGGRLVAVAHRIVVGGTFMVHGLAAPHRLVTQGSVIYGALPPSATQTVLGEDVAVAPPGGQSLQQAISLGLFTEAVPLDGLVNRLKSLLFPAPHG